MAMFVKNFEKGIQFLNRKTLSIIALLFFVGVAGVLWNMSSLSDRLIQAQAIQFASHYVQSIKEARTLYSDNVVNRVKDIHGVSVIPDYASKPSAIPLPATFLIELSQTISQQNPGMSVRLFSNYPFPQRKGKGGPRDDFERSALQALKQNPTQPFFRVENIQGQCFFRYAVADTMHPSCVACHNTHPDSPKRDWKVGDVRGVVEINTSLEELENQTNRSLKGTFLALGGLLLLALTGITLVVRRLRQTSTELELRVLERTSALAQANQKLHSLANLDGLTQVANRRRFDEYLSQELRRMKREQQPLSLIMGDVDYFKRYNDYYGHQSGDVCLKKIAQAMNTVAMRPADLVARYGGEEFAIILPQTPSEGVKTVAEAIRQEIGQLKIPNALSDVSEYVTLSLGIASLIPDRDTSPEDLINLADSALYRAKEQGRDRIIHLTTPI
jgi:diguanylate cyclase (GGDEF)-like protein